MRSPSQSASPDFSLARLLNLPSHLDFAKPLSSLHFALQTAMPQDRPSLAALASLHIKLATLPNRVADPSVADAMLAWWTTELRTSAGGQASHPLTRALYQGGFASDALTAPLLRQLTGVEAWLRLNRLLDEAALLRHASSVGAPIWEAAAICLNLPSLAAPAGAFGATLRLVEIVAGVGLDCRNGRLLIPIEDLQRHEIKAFEILNAKAPWPYDERYQGLMADQVARARPRLISALRALRQEAQTSGRQARRRMRPAFVLGDLALALLDELEASQFKILHQRIALSPVRKWWISLRAR